MKLIGSILIICASVYASCFYEKRLKQSISNHRELIAFIKHIQAQIEYFSKPINQIFIEYKSESTFIKELIIQKEKTDFSAFEPGLRKDLIELFSNLGKGYKKEQLSCCEYCLTVLNSNLDTLKTEFSKKCKVYRSLSLFMGVCTVILLL